MDDNQMMDYLFSLRSKDPASMTQEDKARLMKLEWKVSTQQGELPLDADFSAEEARIKAEEERRMTEDDRIIKAKQEQLDRQFEESSRLAREAGESEQQSVQGSMSFSGFGRSTFAADKKLKIEEALSRNIQRLDSARNLEMQIFEAQRRGATSEALEGMHANLAQLKQAANKEKNRALAEAAKANKELKLSMIDSIQNMYETAVA